MIGGLSVKVYDMCAVVVFYAKKRSDDEQNPVRVYVYIYIPRDDYRYVCAMIVVNDCMWH